MPQPTLEERYDEKHRAADARGRRPVAAESCPGTSASSCCASSPGSCGAGPRSATSCSPRSATSTAGWWRRSSTTSRRVVVYPLMPPGYWAATTEIKTNYIAALQARPARESHAQTWQASQK